MTNKNVETIVTIGGDSMTSSNYYHKFCSRAEWRTENQGRLLTFFDWLLYSNAGIVASVIFIYFAYAFINYFITFYKEVRVICIIYEIYF